MCTLIPIILFIMCNVYHYVLTKKVEFSKPTQQINAWFIIVQSSTCNKCYLCTLSVFVCGVFYCGNVLHIPGKVHVTSEIKT